MFIAYNYNISIRYLKEPAFTETLVNASLRCYNLWRLKVFPICERELRRQEQGIRVKLRPIEAKVNTQHTGVRDVRFNIDSKVTDQWQKIDTQLVTWAQHTNRRGEIKALTVDLLIIYAPDGNQPAASRPSMIDQLRNELPTPSQSLELNTTPRVLAGGVANLMGLRIKLTRYWRCKKHCPNANWCYVLS